MIATGEKGNCRTETCTNPTLSKTNLTQIGLGTEPGLCALVECLGFIFCFHLRFKVVYIVYHLTG
jgi:hypothetical protein